MCSRIHVRSYRSLRGVVCFCEAVVLVARSVDMERDNALQNIR